MELSSLTLAFCMDHGCIWWLRHPNLPSILNLFSPIPLVWFVSCNSEASYFSIFPGESLIFLHRPQCQRNLQHCCGFFWKKNENINHQHELSKKVIKLLVPLLFPYKYHLWVSVPSNTFLFFGFPTAWGTCRGQFRRLSVYGSVTHCSLKISEYKLS